MCFVVVECVLAWVCDLLGNVVRFCSCVYCVCGLFHVCVVFVIYCVSLSSVFVCEMCVNMCD